MHSSDTITAQTAVIILERNCKFEPLVHKLGRLKRTVKDMGGHGSQRGATRATGALVVRPPPGHTRWPPRWGPPPWCPTLAPIFTRDGDTLEQKSFSQFSSRSRRHPLFFSRRSNLEVVLASGEGRSSPSSSPSPLHHPYMTSPLMCE